MMTISEYPRSGLNESTGLAKLEMHSLERERFSRARQWFRMNNEWIHFDVWEVWGQTSINSILIKLNAEDDFWTFACRRMKATELEPIKDSRILLKINLLKGEWPMMFGHSLLGSSADFMSGSTLEPTMWQSIRSFRTIVAMCDWEMCLFADRWFNVSQ